MSDMPAPSPAGLLASLRRQASDLYAMSLDPTLHPQSLNRLAALALERDWAQAAFAFADRRCRIQPLPKARDYLLRAEASRRLGDRAGAAADVHKAREIDTLDPLVNLQALRHLDGEACTEAAAMLVSSQRANPAQLSLALAHLEDTGTRVNARVDASAEEISGWVTWPAGERLTCHVTEMGGADAGVVDVLPDPQHPLATATRSAAAVAMRRSPGARSRVCFVGQSPGAVWEATFEPVAPRRIPQPPPLGTAHEAALLVVVPVYDDLEATVACLDSLRIQSLSDGIIASVVVDDASPNPQIVAELDARAARGDFALIRNASNLGFAASVNAAVAAGAAGEILLLNADTVLPPRALERLIAILRADASVGTVTPLSNNGELTSFPLPNRFHPLPDTEALLAWDEAAERVGAPAIDLPNGIGFCMLVRRHCWELLDGIAQIYGRGYFEDVDLCLRAREFGYRNVCATNLVVGHAGSRSFRGAKRALVMRNLEVINTRFPSQANETAAYVHAVPLLAIFARIERLIPPPPHDLLLVTALSDDHPTSHARIRAALDAGHQALLLRVGDGRGPAALTSTLGSLPQSLRFSLEHAEERDALGAYLGAAGVRRIEFLDVDHCPRDLFEAVRGFGLPADVLVAEAPTLFGADRGGASRAVQSGPVPGADAELPWWAAHLRAGERVLTSDALALNAVRRAFGDAPLAFAIDPVPRCVPKRTPLIRRATADTLAVLAPVATGAATRLIRTLGARLARTCADVQLLVIGNTLDDLGLLAAGHIFVTGPVPTEELARVLEAYGCPTLVSPYRDGLFHVIEDAGNRHSGATAYFDWSRSGYRRRHGDLVLDPNWPDTAAAEQIVEWFRAQLEVGPGAAVPHDG